MRSLSLRETPKRPTLRTRRKRLRALAALALTVFLAGAAYGISFASYLPQVSIQDIAVGGVEEGRANLVYAYVETILFDGTHPFFSRANIFLYPRTEIERGVAEYFPRVESVRISRGSLLATTVVVSIQERETFARWCTVVPSSFTGSGSGSCYIMDRNGFIFAPAATTSASFNTAYVFRGGLSATSSPVGQTYLPGTFAGVLALLERLGQAGFTPLSISAESEDFSVALAQGFELRASFGANVSALVRDLELVLSSETLRGKEGELEYVDLRFGNRVYYKLKGEAQQSAE